MLRLDLSGLSDPANQKSFCEHVINKFENDPTNYNELAEAVKESSLQTLPKQCKTQPGWFRMNSKKLLHLINVRNEALKSDFKRRTRSTTNRLRKARKELKA